MAAERTSLQDRIRRRQHSEFIGREDQVTLFRRNFGLPIDERIYIFNISGQGGIGKSTLLRRFREIAISSGALTALSNDDQMDVIAVMEQLARELKDAGYDMPVFTERCRTYHQRRQELESDPDVPTGLSSFVTRTLVKGGLALARNVPFGGGLVELVDSDTVVDKASEWAEFVARKLRNKPDEILLVREPIETLSRFWLDDLNKIADKNKIAVVLFFDTFERTETFLDPWLRDLLEGNHGNLPEVIQFVIAGREELDRNRWSEYGSVLSRISLEPFTEAEARACIEQKGVTNPQVIDVILQLSGCLPLLVTMLAAEKPDDPSKIGDPSGTAVERFLQWTDDPIQRQAALELALPRIFNRDIVALFVEESQVDPIFRWLCNMPFVEERANGWAYHAVVREQMLRYQHRQSQSRWRTLHFRIAGLYELRATKLQLEEKERWRHAIWRTAFSEGLYHQLCALPHDSLPLMLNSFIECREANKLDIVEQFVALLQQAANECDDPQLELWAQDFERLLVSDKTGDEHACIQYWQKIIATNQLVDSNQGVAYAYKAISHRLLSQYQEALTDLSRTAELNPNLALAIAQRGVTYREMKRYEEALTDLTRAIELDPTYTWCIAQRGVTYRLLKRYEEALTDLTRAIELDPNLYLVYCTTWSNISLAETI